MREHRTIRNSGITDAKSNGICLLEVHIVKQCVEMKTLWGNAGFRRNRNDLVGKHILVVQRQKNAGSKRETDPIHPYCFIREPSWICEMGRTRTFWR